MQLGIELKPCLSPMWVAAGTIARTTLPRKRKRGPSPDPPQSAIGKEFMRLLTARDNTVVADALRDVVSNKERIQNTASWATGQGRVQEFLLFMVSDSPEIVLYLFRNVTWPFLQSEGDDTLYSLEGGYLALMAEHIGPHVNLAVASMHTEQPSEYYNEVVRPIWQKVWDAMLNPPGMPLHLKHSMEKIADGVHPTDAER